MALLLILYAIAFVSGVVLPWWVWAFAWTFFGIRLLAVAIVEALK